MSEGIDEEWARLVALSPEELDAEVRASGGDPVALAKNTRTVMLQAVQIHRLKLELAREIRMHDLAYDVIVAQTALITFMRDERRRQKSRGGLAESDQEGGQASNPGAEAELSPDSAIHDEHDGPDQADQEGNGDGDSHAHHGGTEDPVTPGKQVEP